MFGKHTSSGGTSSVDVNLTLDLTDYVKKDYAIFDNYVLKDAATFTGTTTIDTLAIADSGTTILGVDNQLHFNNTDGYYGFHINNYPYFYVNTYSCYVNTTLGIDTNQEQIVFYRENNFWYFKAEDNGENYKSKQELHLQIGIQMRLNFIKMVILKCLVHVDRMDFIIHPHYIKVMQQLF